MYIRVEIANKIKRHWSNPEKTWEPIMWENQWKAILGPFVTSTSSNHYILLIVDQFKNGWRAT